MSFVYFVLTTEIASKSFEKTSFFNRAREEKIHQRRQAPTVCSAPPQSTGRICLSDSGLHQSQKWRASGEREKRNLPQRCVYSSIFTVKEKSLFVTAIGRIKLTGIILVQFVVKPNCSSVTNTKKCHLRHCGSRTPNANSLPYHSFKLRTLIRGSVLAPLIIAKPVILGEKDLRFVITHFVEHLSDERKQILRHSHSSFPILILARRRSVYVCCDSSPIR